MSVQKRLDKYLVDPEGAIKVSTKTSTKRKTTDEQLPEPKEGK